MTGPGRSGVTVDDVDAAIPPGPVGRWVLGARPRTLPAALVPVLVGTAAAHPWRPGPRMVAVVHHGAPMVTPAGGPRVNSWLCALGALVVALAIQVGTNYANDYSDGVRGTDDVRVGPVRLVASGLASPAAVKRAALVAFGLAGGGRARVGLGHLVVDPHGRSGLSGRGLVLHRWPKTLRLRRAG